MVYEALRAQLLELDPETAGLSPTHFMPTVWGAVMETGYPRGVATLVALSDGTTSLWTSTGGGVIGGGEHADVIEAALQFLRITERLVGGYDGAADDSLPADGEVVLRALTYKGRVSVRAREDDFFLGRHPQTLAYHEAQHLMAQLRILASS